MTTIPSTTVRTTKKPVTTGGARTIRVFDGDAWIELPCPTARPVDPASALRQIHVLIDEAQLLTAEELR